MTRLMSAIGLAVVLSLAAMSGVAAARPERIALTGYDTFEIPGWVGCGDFDVLYQEIGFKEVQTTWTRRDGSIVTHVTGRYQIRMTNMASGAWIRLSIAGAIFTRVSADGTSSEVATGSNGFWHPIAIFFSSNPVDHHPFVTRGRVDPVPDTTQGQVDSLRGTWADICDLLA